jgi:hypothetical protein
MQSSPRLIDYFIHNASDYFKDAEDFIKLRDEYANPSWPVLFDMYVSPLIIVGSMILTKKYTDILSLMGFHRTILRWIDFYRFKDLRVRLYQWNQIVNAIGGPFIATNDPTYHAYVIADGMQRTQASIFHQSKLAPGSSQPAKPRSQL